MKKIESYRTVFGVGTFGVCRGNDRIRKIGNGARRIGQDD